MEIADIVGIADTAGWEIADTDRPGMVEWDIAEMMEVESQLLLLGNSG